MAIYRDGKKVNEEGYLLPVNISGYYQSGSTIFASNIGNASSGQFIRYDGTKAVGGTTARSFDLLSQSILVRATTGAGEVAPIETTNQKLNYVVLDFDKDTIEYAQIAKIMPQEWDGGKLTAKFLWTAAAGTGDVIWGLQAVSLGDNEALDTAFGTAVTVTDTLQTVNNVHITAATAVMTVAGTPAAGEFTMFQIYRFATDGGDTLTADARLLGVIITYGV